MGPVRVPILGDFGLLCLQVLCAGLVRHTGPFRYAELALSFSLNPEFGIPNLFGVPIWSLGVRDGKSLIRSTEDIRSAESSIGCGFWLLARSTVLVRSAEPGP